MKVSEMKKKFLYIFFAALLLIGGIVAVCLSGGDDDYDILYYRPPQTEEIVEERDYSWLYEGRWEISDQGDRMIVTFYSDGSYFIIFYGSLTGRARTETGRYSVEKDRIWMYETGYEKYPGYIDIEGERLTADGLYYRHID